MDRPTAVNFKIKLFIIKFLSKIIRLTKNILNNFIVVISVIVVISAISVIFFNSDYSNDKSSIKGLIVRSLDHELFLGKIWTV